MKKQTVNTRKPDKYELQQMIETGNWKQDLKKERSTSKKNAAVV